jgi:predicted metal-dependent peptidase
MPTQNATPPDHQAVISRLKAALKVKAPFFGALALLTPVWYDPDTPTAATDGMSIYVGDWFLEQPQSSQLFILVHELAHKALLHPFRQKSNPATPDPVRYNVASDYVVNGLIHDTPALSWLNVPDGALYDRRYAGLSAEEVYKLLPTLPPDMTPLQLSGDLRDPANQADPNADPADPNADPADPNADPADPNATLAKVKAQVLAAASGVQPGQLPGEIAKLVVSLGKPRVDWVAVLRRFLLAVAPTADITWSRPSRRSYGAGVYLPAVQPPQGALTQLFVVIDVSGSCYSYASVFMHELAGILHTHPGCFAEVHVLYCDTAVVRYDVLDPTDASAMASAAALTVPAGGGTDLRAGFRRVGQLVQPDAIAAVVVLTDGESPWPDAPAVAPTVSDVPVLVVMPEAAAAVLDPHTLRDIEAIAQTVNIPSA